MTVIEAIVADAAHMCQWGNGARPTDGPAPEPCQNQAESGPVKAIMPDGAAVWLTLCAQHWDQISATDEAHWSAERAS